MSTPTRLPFLDFPSSDFEYVPLPLPLACDRVPDRLFLSLVRSFDSFGFPLEQLFFFHENIMIRYDSLSCIVRVVYR